MWLYFEYAILYRINKFVRDKEEGLKQSFTKKLSHCNSRGPKKWLNRHQVKRDAFLLALARSSVPGSIIVCSVGQRCHTIESRIIYFPDSSNDCKENKCVRVLWKVVFQKSEVKTPLNFWAFLADCVLPGERRNDGQSERWVSSGVLFSSILLY